MAARVGKTGRGGVFVVVGFSARVWMGGVLRDEARFSVALVGETCGSGVFAAGGLAA